MVILLSSVLPAPVDAYVAVEILYCSLTAKSWFCPSARVITGGQGPCGCAEYVEIPRLCLSGVVKFVLLTRRPSALRAERLKR